MIGALVMYWTSGLHTFDMLVLETAKFSPAFQKIWFLPVFLGLPFWAAFSPSITGRRMATWRRRQPFQCSMRCVDEARRICRLRWASCCCRKAQNFGAADHRTGAGQHRLWAFIASVQTDFKYVIGFSSVSHMGLVMMGFATLTPEG